MDINWNEYKSVPTTQNPNKKNIPVNLLKPTEENMDKFNDLLNYCIVNKFRELKMTTSGGIKIEPLMIYPAYYYSQCNLGAELIICKDKTYRFQFRADIAQDEKNKGYSGTKAFMNFKELCNKYNIDLKKYEIENGKLIHDSISNPPIELGKNALRDVIYEHVNHIDFHSSYPAGLANTHPEFYSLINDLFETRRKKELNKATLNYSIGMMHSKNIGYKYASLAKDAIEDNNERVRTLAKIVEASGGIVLLFNTDGFWYIRKEPYHGVGEGKKLGEWENDHIDCQLRIKSVGAYEYIENDKYTPVIRGVTELDKGKARSEWTWGDIYETYEIKFVIDKNGIHKRRSIE